MTEHEVTIEIPAITLRFSVKAEEIVAPPPPPLEELPDPGTAFTLVNAGAEASVGQYDLYFCNPAINVAAFAAVQKPGSVAGAYATSQNMPRYGSTNPFLNGLRAVATEADYWHTGSPPSPTNRLVHPGYPAALWLPRVTRDLSLRMSNYVVANLNPFFKGVYCDECQPEPPPNYLGAYRTAVEWNEADLHKVKDDWNASVDAQTEAYKGAWGSSKFVVFNGAGRLGPDGMTVEKGHITARGAGGLQWMKDLVLAQKAVFDLQSDKFGTFPIVITWNYPDKIPGVYLGTWV